MKNIKFKKRNNKGFTLVELLIVLLILTLLTGLMAMIIPVAARAYVSIVDTANAQVLLSTTVTELRDELGIATEIKTDIYDNTKITFRSGNTGRETVLSEEKASNENKGIYLTDSSYSQTVLLVTRSTSTNKLYITYDSIEYDSDRNVIKVSNLKVTNQAGDKTYATLSELYIRTGR